VYVQELSSEIPRYRLPEHGMLPRTALQVVRDELILDGNARLNLATFVTTWMEPEAEKLMAECTAKNMIDKDEYPQTAELERRCAGPKPRPGATRTPSAWSRSWAPPWTAATSPCGRSARRWTGCRPSRATTCRSTWTGRRAGSSRRSCSRTWSGTSGSRGWHPS